MFIDVYATEIIDSFQLFLCDVGYIEYWNSWEFFLEKPVNMWEIVIAIGSRSLGNVFLDYFNGIARILFTPNVKSLSHWITPFMQLTGPALISL